MFVDLRDEITSTAANEIEMIMMINFIRFWHSSLQVPIDQGAIDNLKAELSIGSHKQDTYMKPVLENDALLHSIHVVSGQVIADDDDDDDAPQEKAPDRDESSKLKEILASYKATLSNIMSESEPTSSNSEYFHSYSNVYIHETMLKDEPRMASYSKALGSEYLQGKTVLDVGCGSGILCMLAARGE